MKLTDKEFLEFELNDLNLTMDNPNFVALAKSVADYCKKFKPESVLDYGCGTGVYSEVLRQEGFNIIGQDIFKSHRDYCKENYPLLKVYLKPKEADLMLWIEVAEHMTDQEITKALEAVKPRIILFSSTPHKTDFDETWGHINIKSDTQWVSMFRSFGYKLIEKPKTPTLWTLAFQKI